MPAMPPDSGHSAEILQLLTTGLLAVTDGALARVWLMGPGDLCEGCPMREECPDQTRCLHLACSAGLSQSIDGPFRRFPIGARKVGRVPQTMETYSSNDDLAALGLADRTWLMAHDVRAFAAAPIVSNGACAGVAAVFSRVPLDPVRLSAIEAMAAIAGGALAAPGLPARAAAPSAAPAPPSAHEAQPGAEDLLILRPWDETERDVLRRVLEHAGGRVSGPRGAAAILHMKPTTLQSRLKKLGVRRRRP
jgi:GAF domain-containing protein